MDFKLSYYCIMSDAAIYMGIRLLYDLLNGIEIVRRVFSTVWEA